MIQNKTKAALAKSTWWKDHLRNTHQWINKLRHTEAIHYITSVMDEKRKKNKKEHK